MRIDGSKLSPTLASRIGEATSGPELSPDFFVHKTEAASFKMVAAAFGLGGVALVALAAVARISPVSRGYWQSPEIVIGLAFGFFSAWLMIAQAIRIRALKRSTIKPAIVASPILIGQTGIDGEAITLFYLRDLVNPSFTHHHTNGAYTHTAIKIQFKDGMLEFDIRNRHSAESLIAFLKATPEKLQRWLTDGSIATKIAELDWIQTFLIETGKAEAFEQGGDPSKPVVKAKPKYDSDIKMLAPVVPAWEAFLLTTKGQMIAALTLATFVTTVSYFANLYSVDEKLWTSARKVNDPALYKSYLVTAPLKWHKTEAEQRYDDSSFERAVKSKSATPLRAYRKEFPQGRHATEAKEAVEKLYVAAEEQYLTHTEKAKPEAAEGMKALFTHMRQEDAPLVRICFLPGKGVDGVSLEKATFEKTGSKRIHGVSGSFSKEANEGREDRIVAVMQESFKKVLPQELFELKKGDREDKGPRFLVHYDVRGTGSFYTAESEDNLPVEKRQIWIGIVMAFDFSLQVPGSKYEPSEDPEHGYRFSMIARPAPNFDVRQNASATEVYDRMVATAFDEFQVELANAYGLELQMPASWGQLSGMQRRPAMPKFPTTNPKSPTNPMPGTTNALGPKPNRAVVDIAMAVITEPGNEKLGPTAIAMEVSKRAKAAGVKTTQYEVQQAVATARVEKALNKNKPQPPK